MLTCKRFGGRCLAAWWRWLDVYGGGGGVFVMESLTKPDSQPHKQPNAQADPNAQANTSTRCAITHEIRIEATPAYLPDKSAPADNHYIFGYHITITNGSAEIVQIVARHWTIIDADGNTKQVDGQGVVGQQPLLESGEVFAYSSYCPLTTPWGTMEGTYTVQTQTDEFLVEIPRFYFIA